MSDVPESQRKSRPSPWLWAIAGFLLPTSILGLWSAHHQLKEREDKALTSRMYTVAMAADSYKTDHGKFPALVDDLFEYFPGASSALIHPKRTAKDVAMFGTFVQLSMTPDNLYFQSTYMNDVVQRHKGLSWVGYCPSTDRTRFAIVGCLKSGEFVKSDRPWILTPGPH